MIILMIKLILLLMLQTQSNAQKEQKQSYSGKEKHTIKTQVIIEQKTKLLQQVFRSRKKHDYLYLKESKIPILKIPN
ncbi:hypothetical protein MNU24_00325 [Spiroplasma poulsonii]|nr:hypothetical protein [Spiroplasma poulsonii]UNF61951.1 hypothetical protein MNU24_00325 [Spiroplasma poulsonii]